MTGRLEKRGCMASGTFIMVVYGPRLAYVYVCGYTSGFKSIKADLVRLKQEISQKNLHPMHVSLAWITISV